MAPQEKRMIFIAARELLLIGEEIRPDSGRDRAKKNTPVRTGVLDGSSEGKQRLTASPKNRSRNKTT